MWEHVQDTTKDHDQRITTHYVQYISVNNNFAVVENFAASVRFVTFENVDYNVEYLVSMWSENAFGNGSASNEVSVVITEGMYVIVIYYSGSKFSYNDMLGTYIPNLLYT